jgi:hypothetical protein
MSSEHEADGTVAAESSATHLLPEEERDIIKEIIMNDKMAVGLSYFLVSSAWWGIWKDYVNYTNRSQDVAGSLSSSLELGSNRPGEIDNSSLLDSKGELHSELVEGNEYELLPEKAWKHLHCWYVVHTLHHIKTLDCCVCVCVCVCVCMCMCMCALFDNNRH